MSYRECPQCRSLNPTTEKICYQCEAELPSVDTQAAPASPSENQGFDFQASTTTTEEPVPFDFGEAEQSSPPPSGFDFNQTKKAPKEPQAAFQFKDKPSYLSSKDLPPDYSSTLSQGIIRGLMAGIVTGLVFAAFFIIGKFRFLNGIIDSWPSNDFIVFTSIALASIGGMITCGLLGAQSALCFPDECLKTGGLIGALLGGLFFWISGDWTYVLQFGILFAATAALGGWLERRTRKPRKANTNLSQGV